MINTFLTITKRTLLFIITNLVIVITVGIGAQLLFHYFNIQFEGFYFILIFYSILGMGGAFVSLWISKWMAIKFMRVKIVSDKDSDSNIRSIVQKVHYLARKAQLPKLPEVGIYDSPEVNAFATGPSKKKSLVAVSTGLLAQMDDTQVEGVLAHEVSHIANGDMVTMTLVQGIVNVMVHLIAYLLASVVSSAISRNRRNFFLEMMIRYLFISLLNIPGTMVVCFFSRWREYRADYGGATLAGRQKMIAALQKLALITQDFRVKQGQRTEFNALKISHISRTGPMSLFSTHPPLQSRINRLQNRVH